MHTTVTKKKALLLNELYGNIMFLFEQTIQFLWLTVISTNVLILYCLAQSARLVSALIIKQLVPVPPKPRAILLLVGVVRLVRSPFQQKLCDGAAVQKRPVPILLPINHSNPHCVVEVFLAHFCDGVQNFSEKALSI